MVFSASLVIPFPKLLFSLPTSIPFLTAGLDSFSNVRRWFDNIKSRPAVRKGIEVGKENRSFGKGITKEALKTMFGQNSKNISDMAKEKKE